MLDLGLVPKDAFSKIRGIQMRFQSPPHPPQKKKKKTPTNKQTNFTLYNPYPLSHCPTQKVRPSFPTKLHRST